jgi:hypothetical protein
MKKLILLGMLMCLCISAAFAQADIVFEEQVYDFGKIKEEDGVATAVFNFKNTGSDPLILSSVTASCGCTVPSWTKEPVPGGQAGEIKASYNASGRPGFFEKTITVKSNASEPTVTLRIKGEVIPRPKTDAQ